MTKQKDLFAGSVIVNKQRRRPFVWPANSTLTAFEFNLEGVVRREKDEYVELVGYTYPTEILCYTIFCHSPDASLPVIQGFSRSSHQFSKLSLTLYGTFLHLPNYPYSLVTSHQPLPMRKNKEFLTEETGLFAPPIRTDSIERFLYKTHGDLAQAYLETLKLTPAKEEAERKEAMPVETLFNRWPKDNDEIHDEYGVWSRHKNEIYSAPKFRDGPPKPPGFQDPRGRITIAQNTPEALAKFGLKSRYKDGDWK